MSKKYRNFKCAECKEVTEQLTEDHVLVINCNCKGLASRCLSAPKFTGNSCGKNASWS